jgi:hypothetical protein
MKTYYKVILKVEESQLSVVLGALAPEVKMLGAEPLAEELPLPPKRSNRYVNGKRNKGISGADLLTEIFSKLNRATETEIQKSFIARGFSNTTVYPCICMAIRNGSIKQVGHGVYEKV